MSSQVIVLLQDQKINSSLIKELQSNFIVESVNNDQHLLTLSKAPETSLILIVTPANSLHARQLCQQIRDSQKGRQLPLAVVLPAEGTHAATAWFEAGIDDLFYDQQDTTHIVHSLKKRIDRFEQYRKTDRSRLNLQKNLRRTAVDLAESQYEIVQRLSKAAERRDPETGDHIHRMSHYCHCIAGAAGIPEKDCQLLLYASPMHDIGKLGIPDSVLLNPNQLSEREWKIMR